MNNPVLPAVVPPLPIAPPPRQPSPPAEGAPGGSSTEAQQLNALQAFSLDELVGKVAAALYPHVGPSGARDPEPPVSEGLHSEE